MIAPSEVFLIGTKDGMTFRRFMREIGYDRKAYWIFQSSEYEYVGPGAPIANSRAELESIVERWWEARKGYFPHTG